MVVNEEFTQTEMVTSDDIAVSTAIENEEAETAKKTKMKSVHSKAKNKEKACKVISYNSHTKDLDVDFEGYGVRLHNIDKVEGDTVTITYKGEIGQKDFTCSVK